MAAVFAPAGEPQTGLNVWCKMDGSIFMHIHAYQPVCIKWDMQPQDARCGEPSHYQGGLRGH